MAGARPRRAGDRRGGHRRPPARGTLGTLGRRPAAPARSVGAPDAESSAWYCTGPVHRVGGVAGLPRPHQHHERDRSAAPSRRSATAVPPSARPSPSRPAASWPRPSRPCRRVRGSPRPSIALGRRCRGDPGGATARRAGPRRRARAPRRRSWYFPAGPPPTPTGSTLSLLNPTSTPVVVDLSFMTPTGAVHPINYQGIVLQPGQVEVENVASEVQNVATVSTVVAARTGRDRGLRGAGVLGLLGRPLAGAGRGHAPRPALDHSPGQGGGGRLVGDRRLQSRDGAPEAVTVRLRLSSGPLAPLTDTVAPGSDVGLGDERTDPHPPSARPTPPRIDATGGPGVVVGRTVALPGSASAPQAGMALAVDGLTHRSRRPATWVVPPPGTSANPAVSGAAPAALALLNTSARRRALHGLRGHARRATIRSPPARSPRATRAAVGRSSDAGVRPHRRARRAGRWRSARDASPSGGVGVVTMPGIPLAAAIGR